MASGPPTSAGDQPPSPVVPLCLACQHLHWDELNGSATSRSSAAAATMKRRDWTCTAFLDGIPQPILDGGPHMRGDGAPNDAEVTFLLDEGAGFAVFRAWREQREGRQ